VARSSGDPRLLDVLRTSVRTSHKTRSDLGRLSERELEVLTLVSRGASNPEIATMLMLSERTIKGHVGSIFAKLGARDRAAAIVIAYEAGLVRPGLS